MFYTNIHGIDDAVGHGDRKCPNKEFNVEFAFVRLVLRAFSRLCS
jgi:hypothetical protein